MKVRNNVPSISGAVIAVSGIVLGGMIALWSMPTLQAPSGKAFTIVAPRLWQVIVVALIVALFVLFRALKDRRSRLERYLLEAFLEHIPDHVYFKDRNSRFVRVNKAMAVDFGLGDPDQVINKTDADIFSFQHAIEALDDEKEIMNSGKVIIGVEEKETWPDGHESWVLTTKVPLKDRRGQIIGTMGISHDITERKQVEARTQYIALHDALTGLPNRVLLADRLAQAISMAHRKKNRLAVLMLDLDRFKTVNDSFGHHVGDRLLEIVAKRLKLCLRESDIVARWGGDEFVIVLPEVDGDEGIRQVAQKALSELAEPFLIDEHTIHIGASIGICQYPVDGENPEALLGIADAAMYESKKLGRGTYSFFTPELTQATRRRQKLECDLRQACIRGEFVLHYQPLVAIDTGHITGVEALLRWNHPELGIIFPGEFISLLEELGLMVDVGAWVIKTACAQNVHWQSRGLPPIRMSVNVSAQQFYRGKIADVVRTALNETGLDPHWLELELTESLTLDDIETSIAIMAELKHIGVSISLDDFGTGWSSLSYLKRFPLDRIKIDRSFLRDIESDSSSEAVVKSILNLGRNLHLACVAEGVETHEQLGFLQDQKCAEMQGYLYSKALPAKECAELMHAERSLELPSLPPISNEAKHCPPPSRG
jgi:diguanylate cyclase (GGDEF)-like protein/PAS domain S-box-containing protein